MKTAIKPDNAHPRVFFLSLLTATLFSFGACESDTNDSTNNLNNTSDTTSFENYREQFELCDSLSLENECLAEGCTWWSGTRGVIEEGVCTIETEVEGQCFFALEGNYNNISMCYHFDEGGQTRVLCLSAMPGGIIGWQPCAPAGEHECNCDYPY